MFKIRLRIWGSSSQRLQVGPHLSKIILVWVESEWKILRIRAHRCWWRMLETKCVGDNFEILVTVLAVFVTNILNLLTLASGTNIQKCPNIEIWSSKPKHCRQHKGTNIYVATRARNIRNRAKENYLPMQLIPPLFDSPNLPSDPFNLLSHIN